VIAFEVEAEQVGIVSQRIELVGDIALGSLVRRRAHGEGVLADLGCEVDQREDNADASQEVSEVP